MNVNASGTGVNSIYAGQFGMGQQMDAVSKNLQKQIENAKKQLQELAGNTEMLPEEKMKKRQEIQKQIGDLTTQLKQHQMEQKREAANKAGKKENSQNAMEEMLGGGKKNGVGKNKQQNAGLSQASMTAMLSADTAMNQAQVQGKVASQMKGKAGALKAEIKQDEALNGDTTKKREALAELEQKATDAASAQMKTLKDAVSQAQESGKEEGSKETEKEDKEETKETGKETKEGMQAAGKEAKEGMQAAGKEAKEEMNASHAQSVAQYPSIDLYL